MPVGLGLERANPTGRGIAPARAADTLGFHPLALWIAAAAPVAATLLILMRLAG
ncbi:hypothetical protein [Methylobacterium sp. J-076]|uniref:hypothetical protein n=1 Tax=Methylobacterium sp. J-076 TaxID=2836655 RepID=UPI001FBB17C7|nr:hypothetical protein [Methylobacterium sp. J-076]MCJ2012095.1 hypothetical protein [Methylobacterium sp. J-076]